MKIIAFLFEAASDFVRWLTGNTTRVIFVLGVLVVLPLSLMLASMIFRGNESSQGAAWREYFQAREEVMSGRQDVDWLEALFYGPQSDFQGNHLRSSTAPRNWALQFAADTELADGSRLVYTNRDQAAERLTRAIEFYDLIEKEGAEGILAERTLLGKAHAHEIMLCCTADLSEFRRNYELAISCLDRLIGLTTNSSIKDAARRRKEVLVKHGADNWSEGDISPGDFYSWLGQYMPPESLENPFPNNPFPFESPSAPVVPFPGEGELLPPPVLDTAADFPIVPAVAAGSDDSPSGGEGDESLPPAGDGDENLPPAGDGDEDSEEG